jgi:hypothetical protein
VEELAKKLLAQKHEKESLENWYDNMRETYYIKILNNDDTST